MSRGFIQKDKIIRHPFGPACAMPKENSFSPIVYLDYQFCTFVLIQAQAGPKGFPKLLSFLIRPFGHACARTKYDESWDGLLGPDGVCIRPLDILAPRPGGLLGTDGDKIIIAMKSFLFLIIFHLTQIHLELLRYNYFSVSSFSWQENSEKRVVDKVLKLPEVILKNKYIDSISKHKSGISILIVKNPSTKNGYYWVQAGYDNKIRFEVIYNFYVYSPSFTIKYFDPINNKVMSLFEWRRANK